MEPMKVKRHSPRKFYVAIPGGGHSGEMSEAEARGWAMGFIRGVHWAKCQIKEPGGITNDD